MSEKERHEDIAKIVSEASKRYGLPVGYINTLIKKGVVSVPFSHIDELILQAFSKTWRSETLLKISISHIPKGKRRTLLEPMSRLDSMVYSLLCSFYKQGSTPSTGHIIYELKNYGFRIPKQHAKLSELKKRIQSLRRKCKKEIASNPDSSDT